MEALSTRCHSTSWCVGHGTNFLWRFLYMHELWQL